MPEIALRKRPTAPAPSRQPSLAMHAGQCSICRHARRAEIETAFLAWRGPRAIADDYGLGSHTTVYRHAHALGLFARRERALQFALRLSQLIDRAGDWESTETDIRSAMRLLARRRARGVFIDEEVK
jgi:hypothetical protein